MWCKVNRRSDPGTRNAPSLTPFPWSASSSALANPRNRVRFQLKQPPGKARISCTNPFHNPPGAGSVMTRHKYQCKLSRQEKRRARRRDRQDATRTNGGFYERNHRAILHLWGLNWHHLPSPVPLVTHQPVPDFPYSRWDWLYKAPKMIWIIKIKRRKKSHGIKWQL